MTATRSSSPAGRPPWNSPGELLDRELTVITNALDVASVLMDRPGIELVVLGGVVRPGMHSTLGHIAELALRELRADTLFMGIGAIGRGPLADERLDPGDPDRPRPAPCLTRLRRAGRRDQVPDRRARLRVRHGPGDHAHHRRRRVPGRSRRRAAPPVCRSWSRHDRTDHPGRDRTGARRDPRAPWPSPGRAPARPATRLRERGVRRVHVIGNGT